MNIARHLRRVARPAAPALAAGLLVVVSAGLAPGIAHAKCDATGPYITDAYVTKDVDQVGMLGHGDAFRVVFNEPIVVHGPSFGIHFVDANSQRFFLGDQWPDMLWRVQDLNKKAAQDKHKSRVLEVYAVYPHEEPVPGVTQWTLAATITGLSGVHRIGTESGSDLRCSTDLVVQ